MKSLLAGLCAFGVWAAAAIPASAAWDNVFQPTLFGLFRKPVSTNTYYVPPAVVYSSPVVAVQPVVAQSAPCDTCNQPAPQPQCSTSYSQRCYYQPVTTYQTKTYYEPVTTYRTSYYYEPVTSYRYSAYYDPCTCGYQQVATPTTSYQLRAQNCPVQSWAQRCVQEPVTSYQKACYWQPQTTCCQTTMGAPIGAVPQQPVINTMQTMPPVQQPQPQVQPQVQPQTEMPPSISGTRTPGAGSSNRTLWDQMYPPMERAPEIRTTPGTSWQPHLNAPVPIQSNSPTPPQPPVKLDRVTVGPNSRVEGQVVRSDSSPKAEAKVLFINAGTGQRQTTYTNTGGNFFVELPSGSWHVYLHGADGLPIHYSRIDVNGSQTRQVSLVSRTN